VANAARGNPDHDLAVARRLHRNPLDRYGQAEFPRDDCFRSLTHGTAAPVRQCDGDRPLQRRIARAKLLAEENPSKYVSSPRPGGGARTLLSQPAASSARPIALIHATRMSL